MQPYRVYDANAKIIVWLPAVEAVEGGDGDVGPVELEEGEEFGAEFLDFGGVEFVAVGGEVVEEGFGEIRVHVAACSHGIAEEGSQFPQMLFLGRVFMLGSHQAWNVCLGHCQGQVEQGLECLVLVDPCGYKVVV